MRLIFTIQEKTDFLKKRGFKVKSVPTYHMKPVYEYHNKNSVERISTKVEIAFKNDPSKKELSEDDRYLKDKYGLDKVFEKELKKALLEL